MFEINIPWAFDNYFLVVWFDRSEFSWFPGELDRGLECPSQDTDHQSFRYIRYCFFGLILVFAHGCGSWAAIQKENKRRMGK